MGQFPNSIKVSKEEVQHKYIDAYWFKEYQKLSRMPGLGSLRPHNRRKEKFAFFRGATLNPHFVYPSLASFSVETRRIELNELKKRLLSAEGEEVVRELYRSKINHKLGDCDILESVQKGDDRRFNELMQKRYGNVSASLSAAVMDAYIEALVERLKHTRGERQRAARELYDQLVAVRSKIHVEVVHEFHLVDVSRGGGKILHAKDIKKLFDNKKRDFGLDDWSNEIDIHGKSNSITVHHKDKRVVIPRGRRLSESQVRALAEHEYGVHIRRREYGEDTKLALLGVGLADFLYGEEGLAKYYENSVYNGAINSSLKSYLLTSLVLGVDGKARSFKEIYKIAELIFKSMKGKYFLTEIRSSKHYAWGKAAHLFRGTTGQTAGVCFRRQLVYLEGYIQIKSLLEKGTLTEEELMRGKYDPSNEAHILALKKLSIL